MMTQEEIAELVNNLLSWAAYHGDTLGGPTYRKAADALEQQARELAAFRVANDTRDKIAHAREGDQVRELNDEVLQLRTALDRASQYYRKLESELICRKISLPSVSDMVKFAADERDALRDELASRGIPLPKEPDVLHALAQPTSPSPPAPGHTDLMVPPETITEEYLAQNPLPQEPQRNDPERERTIEEIVQFIKSQAIHSWMLDILAKRIRALTESSK